MPIESISLRIRRSPHSQQLVQFARLLTVLCNSDQNPNLNLTPNMARPGDVKQLLNLRSCRWIPIDESTS